MNKKFQGLAEFFAFVISQRAVRLHCKADAVQVDSVILNGMSQTRSQKSFKSLLRERICALYVEPEVHDVAVFHFVPFPFDSQLTDAL